MQNKWTRTLPNAYECDQNILWGTEFFEINYIVQTLLDVSTGCVDVGDDFKERESLFSIFDHQLFEETNQYAR